jgi:hypothetical protein
MAFTELAFERLLFALETTRGTAITSPTHIINIGGKLTPKQTKYKPPDARGTLVKTYRSKTVRKWAELEADGAADPNIVPLFLNMVVDNLASPSTPGGATLSRLWEFIPNISADDLKTSTYWFADPVAAAVELRAPFGTIDELTFSNDASGEEVAKVSIKGKSNYPTEGIAVAAPASIAGDLLPGQFMQIWMDTSSAIGTTAVTGRLVKAEHTIRAGIETYKYLAAGPASSLTYQGIGRGKRDMTTKITLEVPDDTQYALWDAGTTVKCRVRHNGELIETTAGPVNWYNYIEFDTYGPLEDLEWAENGANRVVSFTINSQYDSTLGADFRVAVQNARTGL